ncbi:hypothetical protein RhiJN_01800 [Ceratobasidium sp. AG-Ba]|nr:hypothetical protein RhiJN_01800 [Ceratobasidium sp. AG-Ba]
MLAPLLELVASKAAQGAPPSPPEWQYSGFKGLDKTLSTLIRFFLQSFEGGRFVLMPEFIASVGPAAIAPIIEMRRSGYRFPTVFVSMLVLGYLYQTMGAGVILPFWWALHLLLAGHETVPMPADYSEATLVGYFVGFVAFSFAMVTYQTPGIIGIWQFFPAYVLIFQLFSLLSQRFLSRAMFGTSHQALQAIYIFNIFSSVVTHAYTLIRVFKSASPLDSLKDIYLPGFSFASDSFTVLCQDFCKWDYIYIAAATLFSGLWLLRGTGTRLYALGVFVVSSLLLGGGAGFSLIWMIKENQQAELHSKSELAKEEKQK